MISDLIPRTLRNSTKILINILKDMLLMSNFRSVDIKLISIKLLVKLIFYCYYKYLLAFYFIAYFYRVFKIKGMTS